ncbi:hypothetical protein M433DRAFT_130762 [Acidomyces richmondensis BFW]|nr:MAG: hypothetical protein FE78DRAFT_70103 [Acidomyces sp. 'richmondensis']KYG50033.1 hypothetical protein M433DRAFT_130762 [Acidomyces richmondensis BFW]
MPIYCITGANRGIGLEFVRQISKDPSNTIIATIRSSSTDRGDLQAIASSSTHILVCDTGELPSIQSFVKETGKILGGKKINYLVNNAGINANPQQTSLSIGPEDLQKHIQVNVVGPAKTVQFFHEASLLSSHVRIVNMTSGLGSMAKSLMIEPRKCATYSISKAALNSLTVQQSGNLRDAGLEGAVVICMDPGWVKTRMGGEGAMIEPEESVSGMLRCMHGLQDGSNGKFFTYTGEEVPW